MAGIALTCTWVTKLQLRPLRPKPSLPEILIVADDLSGAADCAMACARSHGHSARVILDTAAWERDVDILAVDADTRRMPPLEAAAETERVMLTYARPGQVLFKKLDSTLRGHVGIEVAAALRVWRSLEPDAIAVVAPAFPAAGRTTVGGRQLLNSIPLEKPALCQMLQEAELSAACIAAPYIPPEIAYDVLVCDARTDDDLAAIASLAGALRRSILWAGSAGLARHLRPTARSRTLPGAIPAVHRPLLFIVGSFSTLSRLQAETLRSAPGVFTLPAGTEQDRTLSLALAGGCDVLVTMATDHPPGFADPRICASLAALVARHEAEIGGLVVTGGETARAVLRACGVQALRLVSEVEPGVPLSVTEGRVALPVITKAGAFGDSQTLLRCRAALRKGI